MNSIARRRLGSQHLIAPTLGRAADVVRAFGAVQAQDFGSAKWALAQRTKALRDADVEQAFARGTILRTHVLRPTWHFIVPQDARWMLELTGPRVQAAMASYDRKLGLDAPTVRKSHALLERALRDGAQLTRSELRAALTTAGLPVPTGQHMGNLLMRAEVDRLVISGARRENQFTYALFDDRVPPAPRRDRDDALAELARRYFVTRSPATVHDFAWWSGLSIGDARRGIELAGHTLVREEQDGRPYWAARRGAPVSQRTRSAHLLPNYDEYFIGFKDRSAFAERLGGGVSKTQLDTLMRHVLFVDGQIVGGWRRTADPEGDVQLQLLVKLTPAERELVRRAGRRLEHFLESPVRVRGLSGMLC